jgi:hypothetical protein
MKFIIQETITRDYHIEAETMDDAIAAAMEIDDSWNFDESNHGFTYIINAETQEDRTL